MLNLFTKQTLDGIMSGFTKTLSNLETFAANRDKDVSIFNGEITELEFKKTEAMSDAEQARKYINNIKKMLEG